MNLSYLPHVCVREIVLADSRNQEDIALFARHALAEIGNEQGLGPS